MSPGQRLLVCVSSDARLQGKWLSASTVDGVKYRRWLAKVDADGVSRQAGADTVDMKPKVA